MHSEVIVSLIQGPRAKMFRCSGAQLYRGPEVSRGVQRCPEVSRVQPGVETAASAALQLVSWKTFFSGLGHRIFLIFCMKV